MIKHILILISIFYLTSVSSQEINQNKDGYVQVLDSKLKQKEIHSKLKEWIGINFNKSEEVINFDSEEKIILKGIIPFEYRMYDRSLDKHRIVRCYISNNLIFSIRDNKFKIDFIPIDIETNDKYLVAQRWFYEQLISSKIRTKEEYIEYKKLPNVDGRTMHQYYLNYVKNKNYFNKIVNDLYSSIRSKVNTNEEW